MKETSEQHPPSRQSWRPPTTNEQRPETTSHSAARQSRQARPSSSKYSDESIKATLLFMSFKELLLKKPRDQSMTLILFVNHSVWQKHKEHRSIDLVCD